MDKLLQSNLFQRTASALVAAPIACAAVWWGGGVFALFMAAGAALMLWEWHRLWAGAQGRGLWQAGVAPVLLAVPAVWLSWSVTALALMAAALIISGWYARQKGLSLAWTCGGLAYVLLPCLALVYLRGAEANGMWLVAYVFFVVWATDVGAYASGRLIGGPKIAPRISPNKTWAGLFGGMAGAAALSLAMRDGVMADASPTLVLAAGAVLAVFAQTGDFFESWVKRRFGVKDSGRFLPGHGGILDRVDGIIPVAVIVAAFSLLGAIWG